MPISNEFKNILHENKINYSLKLLKVAKIYNLYNVPSDILVLTTIGTTCVPMQ